MKLSITHKIIKNQRKNNMLFGNRIKQLRNENGVKQRQLADLLEMDTPLFSKIERGTRFAKRRHVLLLAKYFNLDENEMLTLWLADKVLKTVKGEDAVDIAALDAAKCELFQNKS